MSKKNNGDNSELLSKLRATYGAQDSSADSEIDAPSEEQDDIAEKLNSMFARLGIAADSEDTGEDTEKSVEAEELSLSLDDVRSDESEDEAAELADKMLLELESSVTSDAEAAESFDGEPALKLDLFDVIENGTMTEEDSPEDALSLSLESPFDENEDALSEELCAEEDAPLSLSIDTDEETLDEPFVDSDDIEEPLIDFPDLADEEEILDAVSEPEAEQESSSEIADRLIADESVEMPEIIIPEPQVKPAEPEELLKFDSVEALVEYLTPEESEEVIFSDELLSEIADEPEEGADALAEETEGAEPDVGDGEPAALADKERSGSFIKGLMEELESVRVGVTLSEEIISPEGENEDDWFVAESQATPTEDCDPGAVQRHGFVSNDFEIANSTSLPGVLQKQTTVASTGVFSKRRKKKSAPVSEERALSGKDIDLAISLGYDYELAEKIGYDEVKRIKRERTSSRGVPQDEKISAYGCVGGEFTDPQKADLIKKKYISDRNKLKIKTILTVIALLIVFAFENMELVAGGYVQDSFIGQHPAVASIVCLALLTLCFAMSASEIVGGLLDAVRFNSSRFSAVSLSVAAVFVYDVVTLLLLHKDGTDSVMLNSPVLLALVVTLLSACLDCKREYRAFCAASRPGEKFVAEPYEPILKGARPVWEDQCRGFVKTEKTDITGNFFKRTSRVSEWYKNQNFILAPILAISLIVFVISYLKSGDLLTAYSFMVMVTCIGMPTSAVLFNSVINAYAAWNMRKRQCAIIGESAVEEYADAVGIVFTEENIVTAEVNSIDRERTCGSSDMKEISGYIHRFVKSLDSSALSVLTDIFDDDGRSEDRLKVERVERDGFEATTPSGHRIHIGEREYMLRHKIPVKASGVSINSQEIFKKTQALLYVSVKDLMSWSITLEYTAKESFSKTMEKLSCEGFKTGVESPNPNINEEFFLKHNISIPVYCNTPDKITVNKIGVEGNSGRVSAKDSGVVAQTENDIIYPIIWCRRLRKCRRLGLKITVFVSAVISLIFAVSAALGGYGLFNSAALTAISLVAQIPAALAWSFLTPPVISEKRNGKTPKQKTNKENTNV